jgi:hypothetical protein
MKALVEKTIAEKIYIIRGKRVMLDSDLAELYGVSTKRLNEQIRRNTDRFPKDFMFQLTQEETANLKYQFGTSSSLRFQNDTLKEDRILKSQIATSRWGGRRKPTYVFTQEGIAMLSSVLRSSQAVAVNIAIMRAFVRLREILSTHKDLTQRLDELEKKYDNRFRAIFEALRHMLQEPETSKNPIGFQPPKK